MWGWMFIYEARGLGVPDGAGRFAARNGILAVGAFQFGCVARFVERAQMVEFGFRFVVSFAHKLALSL